MAYVKVVPKLVHTVLVVLPIGAAADGGEVVTIAQGRKPGEKAGGIGQRSVAGGEIEAAWGQKEAPAVCTLGPADLRGGGRPFLDLLRMAATRQNRENCGKNQQGA